MRDSFIYDKKQREFNDRVTAAYPILKKLREEDDRAEFNRILLPIINPIKRYIAKGLRTALTKGHISRNKYRPDDFFDQLIIEVYEHLDEAMKQEKFHAWLYRRAEILLDDMLTEEEFDNYFYDNIDDYAKAEWESLEENYSVEGDGDLIMMEDLDDPSYDKHHYILQNVFLEDDANEYMAKVDSNENRKNLDYHIDRALFHLPHPMRSAFELYSEQKFDLDHIAYIKNKSVKEIADLIEESRKMLEKALSSVLQNE